MTQLSANEIEALVLKAARGGGCPLGVAEDLAAATGYLDLNALTECPCHTGAASAIIEAFDAALAHGRATALTADAPLIAALLAARDDPRLSIDVTSGGAVISTHGNPVQPPDRLGRRTVRADLLDHLNDMAARILVPETEASRAAGAGAGLTDND
ncbi:DUF3726 domain-containing protein [Pseudooctadecabacter jejudonensis]|uniref:DUF3726 domain-containing protein n=1 Tax=Pseudooctadecabacter jejudonensis TaxID=1391910 RepID=A0A1Y5SLV9_9RHOB|nr:DUF3726 domain-containing protein [Pseudooctadecabacter jejudonensis]SLN43758.1 hypothetical protein PSJ8397_02254 [Pseudooctadecabacter jejudonensis]